MNVHKSGRKNRQHDPRIGDSIRAIKYQFATNNAVDESVPILTAPATAKVNKSLITKWQLYKEAVSLRKNSPVTMRHLYQYVVYLQRAEIKALHQYVKAASRYELSRGKLLDPSHGFGASELKDLLRSLANINKRPGEKAVPLTKDKLTTLPLRLKALAFALAQTGLRMESIKAIAKNDAHWCNASRTLLIKVRSDKTFGLCRLGTRVSCICEVEHSRTEPHCPTCGNFCHTLFPVSPRDLELLTSTIGLTYHSFRRTAAISIYLAPWAEIPPLVYINRHMGWTDGSYTIADYTTDAPEWQQSVVNVSLPIWRSMMACCKFGYGAGIVPPFDPCLSEIRMSKTIIEKKANKAAAYNKLKGVTTKKHLLAVPRKINPPMSIDDLMFAQNHASAASHVIADTTLLIKDAPRVNPPPPPYQAIEAPTVLQIEDRPAENRRAPTPTSDELQGPSLHLEEPPTNHQVTHHTTVPPFPPTCPAGTTQPIPYPEWFIEALQAPPPPK